MTDAYQKPLPDRLQEEYEAIEGLVGDAHGPNADGAVAEVNHQVRCWVVGELRELPGVEGEYEGKPRNSILQLSLSVAPFTRAKRCRTFEHEFEHDLVRGAWSGGRGLDAWTAVLALAGPHHASVSKPRGGPPSRLALRRRQAGAGARTMAAANGPAGGQLSEAQLLGVIETIQNQVGAPVVPGPHRCARRPVRTSLARARAHSAPHSHAPVLGARAP